MANDAVSLVEPSRAEAREQLFDAYNQNLCRNIIALAEVIQRKLMDIARDAGFEGLKLSYGQVIPLIEPQGTRIIDIARVSGISKQAIGQIANDLERHGYIVRSDDDADRRAKKLTLTPRGIALIRAAGKALGTVEAQARSALGAEGWQQLMCASTDLFAGLQLAPPKAGQFVFTQGARVQSSAQVNIATLFPALAAHVEQKLMNLLIERGYRDLKRSFSQVLAYLPRGGIRINDLADLHGVSKQAISQVVAAIEAQGLVRLVEDENDRRAKKILLSEPGLQLLTDSVQVMAVVEQDMRDVLGARQFADWCAQVHELYRAWCGSYRVGLLNDTTANRSDGGSCDALLSQVMSWLMALPDEERAHFLVEARGQWRLRDEVIDALTRLRLPR